MPPGKREIYQHDIQVQRIAISPRSCSERSLPPFRDSDAKCLRDQVPLIVSGPGIKPQSTVAGMAANYDLAATWAALAGATPSASVSRTTAAELPETQPRFPSLEK